MARISAVSLLLLPLASPALADLSAEDAWDAFRASNSAIEGFAWDSISTSGRSLTVSGARVQGAEEGADFGVIIGNLVFRERGDGTVELTLPAIMPLTATFADEFGDDVTISGTLQSDGSSLLYAGDPGDITLNYDIARFAFILDEISEMPDAAEFDISFTARDLSGVVRSQGTGPISSEFDGTVGSMDYVIEAAEPAEGNVSINFTLRDIRTTGISQSPLGTTDTAELLRSEDLFLDMQLFVSGSATAASFADADGTGNFSAVSGPGTLNLSMVNGALRYAGGASGIQMTVQAPDLPIPVNLGLGSYSYTLGMPLVQEEDDGTFEFGLALNDLTLDDFIWNLFDPGNVLPRDPATLALALRGQGRWLIDILDPEAAAEVSDDEFPGQFSSATIDQIELSIAGASLTGDGAFTFDNSDLFTFGGFPAPDGELNVALTGGNGLLDSLVSMGFLPAEQAMGARMMMGLFMVPGGGADELTSKITVNPTGEVFANGQRLR